MLLFNSLGNACNYKVSDISAVILIKHSCANAEHVCVNAFSMFAQSVWKWRPIMWMHLRKLVVLHRRFLHGTQRCFSAENVSAFQAFCAISLQVDEKTAACISVPGLTQQ